MKLNNGSTITFVDDGGTKMKSSYEFYQPITSMTSHPSPQRLTLLEFLGFKKRPKIIPQRLYVACGATIYVSDVNGDFDDHTT